VKSEELEDRKIPNRCSNIRDLPRLTSASEMVLMSEKFDFASKLFTSDREECD
jgi:hypothetical protein